MRKYFLALVIIILAIFVTLPVSAGEPADQPVKITNAVVKTVVFNTPLFLYQIQFKPVPFRVANGEKTTQNLSKKLSIISLLRIFKEKTMSVMEHGWVYMKKLPNLPTPGSRVYPRRFS